MPPLDPLLIQRPRTSSDHSKDGGFTPLSLEKEYNKSDELHFYKMSQDIKVNVLTNTNNNSPKNKKSKLKFSELAMTPFTPKPAENSQCVIDETEIDILHQYEQYEYTQPNVNMLINGYINNINIAYSIPKDINHIIDKFYFEEENIYIHFSLNLYQITTTMDQIKFKGNQLMDIIMDNVSKLPLIQNQHQNGEENRLMLTKMNKIKQVKINYKEDFDAHKVCQKLLEFGYIELASYKLNFFSLFDDVKKREKHNQGQSRNNGEKAVFYGDEEHEYKFASFRSDQFMDYIHVQIEEEQIEP